MEKHEDRRVAMTKRLLKDALIDLLKEKDIYHISIRELCERADVNRSTFYKYYGSQFELLFDMEQDIIAFVSRSIVDWGNDTRTLMLQLCSYLESNIQFMRLIINNNIDPGFPEKLFSHSVVKGLVLNYCAGRFDEADTEYYYNFITHGAYRIICVWINKEQREPPEKLAELIFRVVG